MMVKLCTNFLRLGLSGMMQTMPSEFAHILQPKYEEIFSLMSAINEYTRRVAPRHAKFTEFPFDLYAKYL